jgi:CubicO group peptidase (beta-lactamase class C family)
LGFIVEKISGLTLHQFCKQHILDPLGMESSSFYLTPNLRERLVDLTFRDNGGPHQHWANQMEIIEQDPDKVRLLLGGAGIYSSMRDYLKILQHLLQIKVGYPITNPIFSRETVEQIFTPALTEQGSKSLSDFSNNPGTQWGAALAICTEDWPQRRRKGSAFWSGVLGTKGIIDPTTGIAVVFGSQLMTPQNFDLDVFNTWTRLEELIYAAITSN